MGVAAFSPEPGRPPSMAAMWSPSGAVLSARSGHRPSEQAVGQHRKQAAPKASTLVEDLGVTTAPANDLVVHRVEPVGSVKPACQI